MKLGANIIKRYLQGSAGPSPEFWEGVWKDSPTELNALSAMVDRRLIRAFRNYLPPESYYFHEYGLSSSYMRHVLTKSGFQVEAEMGFSSKWGLLDIESFRNLAGIDKASRHLGNRLAASPLRLIGAIENCGWTLTECMADFIALFLGNLRLYVARKPSQPTTAMLSGR
jgi:hypothetical protein